MTAAVVTQYVSYHGGSTVADESNQQHRLYGNHCASSIAAYMSNKI